MLYQKLYCPVGFQELELIAASNFKVFPLRFEWQKMFYPALNFAYASDIAEKWNTKDSASSYVGYVKSFVLATEYLKQFEVQNMGTSIHNELCIPSDQLAEFNAQIIDPIMVEAVYYGVKYNVVTTNSSYFENKQPKEQWQYLLEIEADTQLLIKVIEKEWFSIWVNFSYFNQLSTNSFLISQIRFHWNKLQPKLKLFV